MLATKVRVPTAIAARKTPKQQRAKVLVESILQAAAHILEEDIGPFTTNHIARKAGVSIGSLYQYFPGADAIMAALIEKHVADERAAARAVLAGASTRNTDVIRDLLQAFVDAHSSAPRLTARLHALAPAFGLQNHLSRARDEQAQEIAQNLGLPNAEMEIAVMAIEGVVLATLASKPNKLKTEQFLDQLYKLANALLVN